uniref:Uncharacterized protein n=1 Tax=Timema bartmani TaxID=61472 RepID=A0A7R9F4J1_9NEOP|nr:unnamed protein product [Timema bartmani]
MRLRSPRSVAAVNRAASVGVAGPGPPEEQYQIHPLDMKIFLSICLFVALLGLACSARLRREEKKKFTTQYDNVDLDVILKNPRLLKGYLDCLVRDGNCTPDGKELKDSLADALANDCDKCSEKQKAGSDKVIKHLIANQPEDWKDVEKKFDPEGAYRKRHNL